MTLYVYTEENAEEAEAVIHDIPSDAEAIDIVLELAEKYPEITKWILIGDDRNERAIWERYWRTTRSPKLVRASKDFPFGHFYREVRIKIKRI